MFRDLRTSLSLFIILALLTGFVYPMLMLQAGDVLFPEQVNGSMVKDRSGKLIGSSLIGQNFIGDNYFHPRPSAANYDAANSTGSNLAASAPALLKDVTDRVNDLKKFGGTGAIPVDLVTSSGSGLDPDISPAAANFQLARIAAARHLPITQLQDLVTQHTVLQTFGFIGAKRVNVLELNRVLDQLATSVPAP